MRPSVQLNEALASQRALVGGFFDDYRVELAQYRDISLDPVDPAYLDAYWSDPRRYAFLMTADDRPVGFTFVRGFAAEEPGAHELAAFYIEPESRRLGFGRAGARSIWTSLPGAWMLQVHDLNLGARQFWTTCIEAAASGPARVRTVRASDGPRQEYRFRVSAAG